MFISVAAGTTYPPQNKSKFPLVYDPWIPSASISMYLRIVGSDITTITYVLFVNTSMNAVNELPLISILLK
jgi:hypothetical protein